MLSRVSGISWQAQADVSQDVSGCLVKNLPAAPQETSDLSLQQTMLPMRSVLSRLFLVDSTWRQPWKPRALTPGCCFLPDVEPRGQPVVMQKASTTNLSQCVWRFSSVGTVAWPGSLTTGGVYLSLLRPVTASASGTVARWRGHLQVQHFTTSQSWRQPASSLTRPLHINATHMPAVSIACGVGESRATCTKKS